MFRTLTIFSKATRHASSWAAAMAALLSPVFSSAQVMPRITSPVEDSAMVTLKGNTHPLAQAQFDRGPVEDSKSGRMLLVLKRSDAQEKALRDFEESQHLQGSPNFHKWLTPEQFGEQFGVADSDISTVTDYLRGHGFTVGRVYTNKMAIELTGTAGQLRDTFRTQIHSYNIHGHQYFANATDPKIPSALAPVVAGFASLNNIRNTASSKPAAPSVAVSLDAKTHRFKPQYTGTNPDGTTLYLVAPSDLQKIYDIPTTVSTNGTSNPTGTGVNVGVVNDAQINVNLVTLYQSLAQVRSGGTTNAPIEIIDGDDPIDATLSADAVQAYAQLELISASAPYANLYYYASGDTDYDTGMDFAIVRSVQDNFVSVLVTGAQSCEAALGASGDYFIDQEWLQAAAQGITVVAATGDSGSAGCDTPGVAKATGGLAVNGYASTPYDIAVGGTDFYYGSKTGGSSYWATNNSSTFESANGYIPEQAWNDSIISANDPNPENLPSAVYGGGGGYSTVGLYPEFGGTGTPYPAPSWQTGYITGTARGIPDVSFFAGNNYSAATYALCTQPADCNFSGTPYVTETGGTAAAAGVFAGIMADVVQKMGARQGNAGAELYSLYPTNPTTNIFHDTTTASSNSMLCTGTTGGCNGTNLVAAGKTAYSTATGWDAATGLGSVDANKLITNWANLATKTTSTAMTITAYTGGPAVTKAVHGTGLAIYARVSPTTGTGTPTGSVAIDTTSPLPAYGSITELPLVSGLGKSEQNYFLPGGTYNITAYYPGDTTYQSSTSPAIPFTVTPEPSYIEMISSSPASGGTVPYGTPVSITMEPYSNTKSNVTAATGTIMVFNGGSYPIQTLPLNAEGATTYYSNVLAQGNYSLTFKYSGDPSFQPSETSSGYPFTVSTANTTTTLAASSSTVTAAGSGNGAVTVTATVASTLPSIRALAPSGTVTFNTVPQQQIALTSGYTTGGQPVSTATVTISSTQLPTGGKITATYGGDGNYATSNSSVTLTKTSNTYTSKSTTTLTANANPVNANGTLTLTAACTKTNGTATVPGTVQFYADGVLLNPTPVSATGGTGIYTVPLVDNTLPFVTGPVKFTALFTPTNTTYSPSVSDGLNVTITDNRTNSDFALVTDSTTQVLSPTASNTYFQAQVTSIANFSSLNFPITLTCTVPGSSNLTCIFPNSGKNTITVSMGSTGVLLTSVEVSGFPSGAASLQPQPMHQRWWLVGGGSTLACLLIFGIPARRKAWQGMLTVLVCAAFVTSSLVGCGGTSLSQSMASTSSSTGSLGNSSPTATANATGGGVATNSVTPGQYQVVITGTATTNNTTLTHNTPVKVIVSTTPTLPNGTYTMTSINSLLLATDLASNPAVGTPLEQEAADGGKDQGWIFTYQSAGYYTIQSAANPNLYVTEASSPGSGTNATLQTVTGDSSQLWALDAMGGTKYEVVNGNTVANGSTPGVLDDNAFGATPGTTILVYPQKDITQSVNQVWYIQP